MDLAHLVALLLLDYPHTKQLLLLHLDVAYLDMEYIINNVVVFFSLKIYSI